MKDNLVPVTAAPAPGWMASRVDQMCRQMGTTRAFQEVVEAVFACCEGVVQARPFRWNAMPTELCELHVREVELATRVTTEVCPKAGKPGPPFMSIPKLPLRDGNSIPQLGFGLGELSPDQARSSLGAAFNAGFSSIDTAELYGNESAAREAIRASGKPRAEIFVATKVWNDHHGAVREAFQDSLARLGLEYIDLFLIHWPVPSKNLYVQAWKSMIELQKEGLIRSIGVCNFQPPHIQRLADETGVLPAINQIELHPLFPQQSLRNFNQANGIVTQAWSPLALGRLVDNPLLMEIGKKHGKTYAQVVLRWHMQLGVAALTRSTSPSRIKANAELFDFELDAEDLRKIATLDRGQRLDADPAKKGSAFWDLTLRCTAAPKKLARKGINLLRGKRRSFQD